MLLQNDYKIRQEPRIKDLNRSYFWHDWRKGDYTKIKSEVNYCSINHMELPAKPGIYFFYIGQDLVYIGRAKDIRKRIGTHISINKHITNAHEPHQIDRILHRVDKVETEIYPEEELDWIELFYMTKLKPSMNALTWKYC